MPSKKTPAKKPTRTNKKRRTTTKKRKSSSKSLASWIWGFKWATIIAIWGSAFMAVAIFFFAYDLPDARKLLETTRRPGISIVARDGSMIATHGEVYGATTKVEDLPPHVSEAILAIEDRRFYHHFGIDVIGIMRAIYLNFQAGRVVQGGSTLTQQLSKRFFLSENMYKSSDRSFRRKIQELLFSLWLEYKFSKKQILSMYLNRVYLGSGVYGIEAAAHKYFGKRAKHLTLYESAVIAGLLKAPSRFSPTSDPDRANQRAQTVLVAMVDAGFISHKRRASLKSSRARMRTAHEKAHVGRYFVDWIIDSLPNYIGKVDRDIVVKTTFDPKLQRHAEREARKVVSQYRKEKKVSQVAVLSMSTDGAVRAMVGGMDYGKSKFNRAVQAMRQSGSIFKIFPFLAALENGYDRKTRVSDGAIKIGSWKPKNYLWRTRGDLSLQDTFAYSVNTGTVRVSKKLGLKKIKRVAHRLGITQPLPNDLTIVLGTGNVTLLQLTASVATVANGGRGVWPYGIVEIRDRKGKILYRRKKSGGNRVLSQTTANQMAHMLNAVMQYGTGKSASISAGCCGKTGTTQNYVDAWIVGYADNPRLVTGVWLGNDNNKPMKKVTGGSLPGKVWKNYMSAARKK